MNHSIIMDCEQIKRYLPHRYPFLLVDRVTAIDGQEIHGFKLVSANEPYFQGHFPNKAIMPGVLMIEALAQLAGILIYHNQQSISGAEQQFVLAGVDSARFKRVVVPGDCLTLYAKLQRSRNGIYKFDCEASVDGELAVEAQIINAEYRET